VEIRSALYLNDTQRLGDFFSICPRKSDRNRRRLCSVSLAGHCCSGISAHGCFSPVSTLRFKDRLVRSIKEGPSRVVHVAHDRRTVPELRIRGTG